MSYVPKFQKYGLYPIKLFSNSITTRDSRAIFDKRPMHLNKIVREFQGSRYCKQGLIEARNQTHAAPPYFCFTYKSSLSYKNFATKLQKLVSAEKTKKDHPLP